MMMMCRGRPTRALLTAHYSSTDKKNFSAISNLKMQNSVSKDSLLFFAIGDFGHGCPNIANAMNLYSDNLKRAPDFILGLGDNFYPCGVQSTSDIAFKTTWADVFLIHKNLRVPWKMVLGNHDYEGAFQAQIDYTFSPNNDEGLWQCPGQCYKFTHEIMSKTGGPLTQVDFFALDTNGCQEDVRRHHPNLQRDLIRFRDQLQEDMLRSSADWKIVFGHHPLHTKGRHHAEQVRSTFGANLDSLIQ